MVALWLMFATVWTQLTRTTTLPGQAAGNALNWRYSMNVKADGKTWLLHFGDWMYLQDSTRLFNKTEMKKFGVTVATVTLFFTRKEGG